MKKISLLISALLAYLSLPVLAATPTSAVELAQTVDMSEAKTAALIIIGLLITLGVTLKGAKIVLRFFRPS